MTNNELLPFKPESVTPAQRRFAVWPGTRTTPHNLYAYQLRRWCGWCESNGLDP